MKNVKGILHKPSGLLGIALGLAGRGGTTKNFDTVESDEIVIGFQSYYIALVGS
jgi:hypothetical protein